MNDMGTASLPRSEGMPNPNDYSRNVASVTGVAGAGLRLSLLLNAVACQVANSGVDIHSISKGISLFASALKQVGQNVQASDSVHTRECLDTARQISDQAQTVFDEIEDTLDKVQREDFYRDQQALSVQQRFKACFKKQRVTYLLAYLESLKLSLAVMLQILQIGRLLQSKISLDEVLAHERADAQNMLIVRYWSIKRLDRLWDLARQEVLDTEKDEAARTPEPDSQFSMGVPQIQRPGPDTSLIKLPIIPLGVDTSLSAMEDSPKDMLRLTETVLNALLARWVRVSRHRHLHHGSNVHGTNVPRVYVSSGSEDSDLGDEVDGNGVQGYYLEGATTDWRKPQSQEARKHAAHLRMQYSGYQAHVESEPEDSDASRSLHTRRSKKKSHRRIPLSSDESDHFSEHDRQPPTKSHHPKSETPSMTSHSRESQSRSYAYIPGEGNGYSSDRSSPLPAGPPSNSRPVHPAAHTPTQPVPIPQHYNNRPDRILSSPRSKPTVRFAPSPQMPVPSRAGAPPHYPHYTSSPTGLTPPTAGQGYYNNPQMQQPRYNASQRGVTRSHSDTSHQHQHLSPHPPHRRSRSRKGSNRENSERHMDLKRTATRGILGASAIAGFMDALEAFSII